MVLKLHSYQSYQYYPIIKTQLSLAKYQNIDYIKDGFIDTHLIQPCQNMALYWNRTGLHPTKTRPEVSEGGPQERQ